MGQNYTLEGSERDYYTSVDPFKFGKYQFLQLSDVIDNFMATYVGDDKILGRTRLSDVNFHAHRAFQELHYDTFKSCKSQEIEVPDSLSMILPHDYVNYVKLSLSDSNGVEHTLYPALKTSNPTSINQQTSDNLDPGQPLDYDMGWSEGDYIYDIRDIDGDGKNREIEQRYKTQVTVLANSNITVQNFATYSTVSWVGGPFDFRTEYPDLKPGMWISLPKTNTSQVQNQAAYIRFIDDTTIVLSDKVSTSAWGSNLDLVFTFAENSSRTRENWKNGPNSADNTTWEDHHGQKYGLDPQFAQNNGSYYIDCALGKIFFGSNLLGKTVILKYISDGLGTTDDLLVPKLAEEAMYKWIAHGVLSAKAEVPEYLVARFRKEKYAETRKAKIRLSNIKLEEITQIFRGKAKHIKH